MTTKPMVRPFATHYYTTSTARSGTPVHQGAAKTEDGAKRSTVVRIILSQYAMAQIIDRRSGAVIYTLRRAKSGITIHYGRS